MSWENQIRGVFSNKNIHRSDTLTIGNSDQTSVNNNINNLPLAIPLSVINKARKGKDKFHSLGFNEIFFLDNGIKNAPITIVNPERNALIYITDIMQSGFPVVAIFDMNSEFDGDKVHKATSIHLRENIKTMLENLPSNATVYVKKDKYNSVGATNNLRGLAAKIVFVDNNIPHITQNVNNEFSLSQGSVKEQQFRIIQNTNPAANTYQTWIRSADDVRTLSETLEDPDWEYEEFNPDLTRTDIENAIDSGVITVYSSHPIKNGVFVSPSRMEAESYSGNGKIYQKTVDINNVAVCVKFAKGRVHSVQVLTPDNKNVELLKTTDTESRTEKIDYSVSRSTNTTKNSHINSASDTMISQPTFDVNSNFPLIPKESQTGEVTPVEVNNSSAVQSDVSAEDFGKLS